MTVFTPPQVATRWKCKPETIRKLLETGRLIGFTVSPPGTKRPHWRVTLDAVLAYEAGDTQPEQKTTRASRRKRRREVPAGPF